MHHYLHFKLNTVNVTGACITCLTWFTDTKLAAPLFYQQPRNYSATRNLYLSCASFARPPHPRPHSSLLHLTTPNPQAISIGPAGCPHRSLAHPGEHHPGPYIFHSAVVP